MMGAWYGICDAVFVALPLCFGIKKKENNNS